MEKQTLKAKVYLISLIAIAVTLPTTIGFNLVFVYLYGVVWISTSSVSDKVRNFRFYRTYISLFFFYFFLLLTGLLYTENSSSGLKIVEKNIVFVILPVLMFTGMTLSKQKLNIVLGAFITACVFSAVINLLAALIRFCSVQNTGEFFYYNLSQTFNFHPVYLSIYYLLCIIILFSWFDSEMKKIRWIVFLVICFLVVNIVLLESKMVYGISIILLWIVVIRFLNKKMKLKNIHFLIITALIIICASIALSYSRRFREVISVESFSILKEDSMNDFSKINGLTLRGLFWKFSIAEFVKGKNNFLFGVGTGDEQDFLNRAYEKHNMAITLENERIGYYDYDAHNQYLDVFFRLGLIGLAFFLTFLFILFKATLYDSNNAAFYFLIAVVSLCFTETFLGLNKGIVFFVFFSAIFIMQSKVNTLPQTKRTTLQSV